MISRLPAALWLLTLVVPFLWYSPSLPPSLPERLAAICIAWDDECPPVVRRAPVLLPDLATLPPADFRLLVDEAGERRMLRFSNAVVNLGPGAIEVAGAYRAGEARVAIAQKVFRGDGSFTQQAIGALEFHPEHNHWHWDGFSIYEVWSVTAAGELGRRIAASGKVGYCFRDNATLAETGHSGFTLHTRLTPEQAVYVSCGWQRQGISAGWTDIYDYKTPGQIIDLGHSPDGLYALVSVVDPDGRLTEVNTANNTAIAYFALAGRTIEVYGSELPE